MLGLETYVAGSVLSYSYRLSYSYLRPMLVRTSMDEIVAGPTDGYSYHYQDRQHQLQHGNAGGGRFQRRNPRRQGSPTAAARHLAMAGMNAVAVEEERACFNCNKTGHLREECPEPYAEVRAVLKKVGARARGRGRGRGRGRRGPAVASLSIAEVQNMVNSRSGAELGFLPDKWLIDSGSDINIFYNYELFLYISPAKIENCTPIGSMPLPVNSKGVVKMCVEQYTDHDGLSRPIDREIENVYWIPWSTMNELATPEINKQNIFYLSCSLVCNY